MLQPRNQHEHNTAVPDRVRIDDDDSTDDDYSDNEEDDDDCDGESGNSTIQKRNGWLQVEWELWN